jgi:DoxX-like protein
MVLVADLFSGLLAFAFGGAAIGKLARQRQQVQTAEKLRIPWNIYRWIAVPEAAACVGLLIGYASSGSTTRSGSCSATQYSSASRPPQQCSS